MAYSKYHARKVEVDGITFHSKAEANRYLELKLLEKTGEIANLLLQPKYPLVVNRKRVGTYIGDFYYHDCKSGAEVLEDVKGVRTAVYQLKKKLVKALYGIDILETGGRR